MKPKCPQAFRNFFVTFVTAGRRSLFRVSRNAELLIEIFQTDQAKGRYELHAWVIMPDHVHLLLTPAPDVSLEKAIQFIKGGFSFRLKATGEVWQRSFTEHRIANQDDFCRHVQYIEHNPVRARLADRPEEYPYSSATHQAVWPLKPSFD